VASAKILPVKAGTSCNLDPACFVGPPHRYLRKVDCSSFVMCTLLALPLPRAFLQQPLTVLTRQTRQVVISINQSIINMMSMAHLPILSACLLCLCLLL
jgi:hypothetical protein